MEDIHIVLDVNEGDDPIEFDISRDQYMRIARIAVDSNITWDEALNCILIKYREAHPVLTEVEG